MMLRPMALAILLLAVPAASQAQSSQPYAGLQGRKIKALSEQQIADLRTGRGMGLAMAAELNGYPGPAHVLELADKLGLKPEQKDQVKKLLDAMKDDAILIGEKLIDAEAELDREFAAGAVNEDQLRDQVQAIAALQGKLRFTHLRYHLVVAQLLTPEQIARYNELRGYTDHAGTPSAPPAGHMHQH